MFLNPDAETVTHTKLSGRYKMIYKQIYTSIQVKEIKKIYCLY